LPGKLICEQTAWVAQVSAALVVTHDQTKNRLTAFYDGKCPMCATLANAVSCSAQQDTFDLRDMHKQKSMPFATDAVEKEIHVVDRDGQTYRGAQTILKIASQYPRLRVLAAIGQLPVIRPLLPVGYNVVARNRRFLFGAASRFFG
jgi:predicted DCC family thiol-disulfide oxidoreductase YuxK